MRGHNLRELLTDLRKAVGSVGASDHVKALASTEAMIARDDNASLDDLVTRVSAEVDALTQPAWQTRLDQIRAAALSEQQFLRAFEALKSDKSIKKAELLKVTEAYVGIADKKWTNDRLLDSIKTRFYSKLYDEVAGQMAKRATPW